MGYYRIEVGPKRQESDRIGESIFNEIKQYLLVEGIERVNFVSVFELNVFFSQSQVKELGKNLFVDPVIGAFSVNEPLFEEFDFGVEVGFLPNVTDNVGIIARRGIGDFFGKKLSEKDTVFSKKLFLFSGNISQEQVSEIAKKKLFNPLIERVWVFRGKKNAGK